MKKALSGILAISLLLLGVGGAAAEMEENAPKLLYQGHGSLRIVTGGSPGPIHLASLTGAEVAPVTINYSSCWSMRSWDGFQIPKPFAKITLVIGDPIPIPPHLDAEGIEK